MAQGLDWRTSFLRRMQHFIEEIQDPQFPRQELTPDARECLKAPATDILIAAVLRHADHNQYSLKKTLNQKFGETTVKNWRDIYEKRYRSIGFNDLIQQGQMELDAWNRTHGVSASDDSGDAWETKAARNSDFAGRRIRPASPPPNMMKDRPEKAAAQAPPRAGKPDDKPAPGGQSPVREPDSGRARLWLVYIENEKENFSLFVTAETPRRAGEIWADHYGFQLEKLPSNQLSSLKAAPVPDAARIGAERAYDWRDDGPGCVEVISPRAARADSSPSM